MYTILVLSGCSLYGSQPVGPSDKILQGSGVIELVIELVMVDWYG